VERYTNVAYGRTEPPVLMLCTVEGIGAENSTMKNIEETLLQESGSPDFTSSREVLEFMESPELRDRAIHHLEIFEVFEAFGNSSILVTTTIFYLTLYTLNT